MCAKPSSQSMAPITPMTLEPRQLLLLQMWMSPSFPTGSFAYSHGLERAIEDGIVGDAGELTYWISDLLTRGSGWNDAVLFSQCWSNDPQELNDLALAMASSKERYLETTQLGRAFDNALGIIVPRKTLTSRTTAHRFAGEDDIAYPIAAGFACHAAGMDRSPALLAFLQGFANTLVSVAVRLVPLGQTQGLQAIRDLMPVVVTTAERAALSTLADLGSITLSSDIAAMKHETQHSRIFRS